MKNELLEKAVLDTTNVLLPVLNASYALKQLSKIEILEIAQKTNTRLGYELFDDLYHTRLVHDFALVSRAVANNAIRRRGE